MSKLNYIAIVEAGEDGGYGVFFPDLDGCVTIADTLSEAAERAAFVLQFHIKGMAEVGEPVPPPTMLDDWSDPDVREVARMLVTVDDPRENTGSISIASDLWERLAVQARARGLSRSDLVMEALQKAS